MARNGCYFMSDRKKENEWLRFYSLFHERGRENLSRLEEHRLNVSEIKKKNWRKLHDEN